MMRLTFPMHPDDFVSEHPLWFKPRSEYWSSYTGPVRRALQTLGCELVRPETRQDVFEAVWHFPERDVRTGFCYADWQPLTGQYPRKGLWADYEGDCVFKMKFHPGREDCNVDAVPMPVYPGGFCLAVGAGAGDTDKFVKVDLPQLRAIKDEHPQIDDIYWNDRMLSQVGAPMPNCAKFRAHPKFTPGKRRPVNQHQFHMAVAQHRFALNVCRQGWSMDRKITEFCAIGAAIISDRGLEDCALPWDQKFVHGENIWFVDGPGDVEPAMRAIDDDIWHRLVEGSRALYELCFSPHGLGRWYRKKAEELV